MKQGESMKMNTFVAVAAGLLAGCTQHQEVADQKARKVIEGLVQRVEALEARASEAPSVVASPAEVELDSENYGVGKNNHGSFLAFVSKVAPHVDGFKVTVAIINTASVTFNGASVTLTMGDDDRTAQAKAVESFRPGAATYVNVVVAPAKADELRPMKVGVVFDQVAFSR